MQQDFKKREQNLQNQHYQRTQMQKEIILRKLKERGCRITKQRLMLLDIILEEKCSCCKEIYYKASLKDEKVGFATVYRMINILEDIGAISRKNMYKIEYGPRQEENVCMIEFEDNTVLELPAGVLKQIVQKGLSAYGYINEGSVKNIIVSFCDDRYKT